MGLFDKNFKEIFSAQLFAIIGGIIAGVVLAVYMDKIFLIPGMLIIIPGFMEMRGNISGTFASRISSGLFLGVINPSKPDKKIIRGNLRGSFILALIVSLALGLVAFIFNYLVMGVLAAKIIIVTLLAGILSNFILNRLTLFTTIYLFKKGHDPNNIMGPFVTTAGDIISTLSLLVIILLII
ncbi:MAG TPA: magnesium transporter [Bacillota bacterium]|nr:magnesium transporter [Bacillota bacterium]